MAGKGGLARDESNSQLIVCWENERQRLKAHVAAVQQATHCLFLTTEQRNNFLQELLMIQANVAASRLTPSEAVSWIKDLHQAIILAAKDNRQRAWEAELEVARQQTALYEELSERAAVLVMQADLFGRADQLKLAGIAETLAVDFTVGASGQLNELIEADLQSLPRQTWEDAEEMLTKLEGKLSLLSLSQKARDRRARKQADSRQHRLQSSSPLGLPYPARQTDLGDLGVKLLQAERQARRGRI